MKNRRFPYGYAMSNGKIIIETKESEIIRWIYQQYIAGRNLLELSEILEDRKIEYVPGIYGWNKSRIRRILEDKRYTGDDKYPMIINRQIFIQANTVKTERRTNTSCMVDATNKSIVYAVKCACCGGIMTHKTDRRSKCVEQWFCNEPECEARINMTIEELLSAITHLLNMCISDSSLADQDEDKQEISAEIILMENEINRMIGQTDVDKAAVQNKILECAAKKYEQIKSKVHITQRLKAEFEKSTPLSDFYIDLFDKTVSAIRLNIDGEVSLVLKNGKLIGKGEPNGKCSSTA